MNVNAKLNEINEKVNEMSRKLDAGQFISQLKHEVEEIKALIGELCNDENPNARKLGRANRSLFNEVETMQKLREKGKHTPRQIRKQLEKIAKAKASLTAVIKEVC